MNLIPVIEANCRVRLWFSVSSSDDRDRLVKASGHTVDITTSIATSTDADGNERQTITETEKLVPRLDQNDLILASDNSKQCVVRIGRGDGYAQYGGFPLIVETDYHISEDEYERRKAFEWPTNAGAIKPGEVAKQPGRPGGPEADEADWSTEVIGGLAFAQGGPSTAEPATYPEIAAMFEKFDESLKAEDVGPIKKQQEKQEVRTPSKRRASGRKRKGTQ